MRPGVTKIDEKVKKDGIVKVTFGKQVICIGLSLYDSNEIEKLEKGIVVKNVHRKGDKFWVAVSEYLTTLKQKR
jgi:predicted RNA-binding protein (TIGR00451 family)